MFAAESAYSLIATTEPTCSDAELGVVLLCAERCFKVDLSMSDYCVVLVAHRNSCSPIGYLYCFFASSGAGFGWLIVLCCILREIGSHRVNVYRYAEIYRNG